MGNLFFYSHADNSSTTFLPNLGRLEIQGIFQNSDDISKVHRCIKSKPQNAIDQLGKFRVYLREKVARNGSLLIFNLAILYRLY